MSLLTRLDAGLHTARHDEHHQRHEDQVEQNGCRARRDLTEIIAGVGWERREQRVHGVARDPPRDDRVVGEDQEPCTDEEEPERHPCAATRGPERADRASPRRPAEPELGDHHGNADEEREDDVEQDERSATVLRSGVRESPHVAQPDRRPHGREQEPDTAAPQLAAGVVVRRCRETFGAQTLIVHGSRPRMMGCPNGRLNAVVCSSGRGVAGVESDAEVHRHRPVARVVVESTFRLAPVVTEGDHALE
jgi:hypothetical protein